MNELLQWLGILGSGLLVTVELALAATALTVAFSAVLALADISPWRIVRLPALLYADVFRSIPLLALLIFVYYGLGPFASKLGISAFWLAVAGLTISESAYLSEVYRGGLQAIPDGQWDAAASLGLGWFSTARLVVLPQALPPAVPSTMNMAIAILKDSSLASLIAVPEVTLTATFLVSETFRPLQVYAVLALLYLALVVPLTLLAHRVEGLFRDAGDRFPGVHVGEAPPVLAGEGR
jgi:His/Glu/Gln/Arg/opine family amino acid ABC transporter permease subunit